VRYLTSLSYDLNPQSVELRMLLAANPNERIAHVPHRRTAPFQGKGMRHPNGHSQPIGITLEFRSGIMRLFGSSRKKDRLRLPPYLLSHAPSCDTRRMGKHKLAQVSGFRDQEK
jgi:hypothetical protein